MTNHNPQEAAVELRFRLVVEAAPNAMVMINPAGAIVMVNVPAERVFAHPRDELLGQPVARGNVRTGGRNGITRA